MKRLFYLIPCLLLCCILVFSPVAVSAQEVSYEFALSDTVSDITVPSGMYNVDVIIDGFDGVRLPYVLTVTAGSDPEGLEPFEVPGLNLVQPDIYWIDDALFAAFYCVDNADYLFGTLVLTPVKSSDVPVKGESPAAAVSVFDVFAGVGSWLVGSLASVSGIFWNATSGELTLLGVLAVSALGIAVVLGLFYIISRFLKFRA